MTDELSVGLAIFAVGALLYVAVGAGVLTLKPRRRPTLLLSAFAILYGVTYALSLLPTILHLEPPGVAWPSLEHLPLDIPEVTEAVSSLAILALTVVVPRRLEDRRPLAIALALGFGFSAVLTALVLYHVPTGDPRSYFVEGIEFVDAGAFWSAAALLALRASPSRQPTVRETRQLAILAVAFAFFWVFISGSNVVLAARWTAVGEEVASFRNVAILGAWLTPTAIWGYNMVRARDDNARTHRAVMLAMLGLLLAGSLASLMSPMHWTLAMGLAQIVGVGLLAYGILRHDLAALDAKVEWGLSKTTVAGVFVAVFFVVSEGAQALFADFAGNEFLGVLAAGLLVFAISPLQRFADRFAAKAVPGPGDGTTSELERRYRTAVETALADGTISSQEERYLAELAEELGLDHVRVHEIREAVQAESQEGTT